MAIFLLVIFSRGRCHRFINVEEEVFASPGGTNTIIVPYDPVCRPTIYKKGMLWNQKIWGYPGSGFMETVHFGVEWLSEEEIRFTYDDTHDEHDEEYFIRIPL